MPTLIPYILSITSALALSFAWWQPGSSECALLGWIGAVFLVATVRLSNAGYRQLLLHGCICNALGFYWLYGTIKDFGGFPAPAAAAVFLLFVILSANQQLIFLFLYRAFSTRFHQSCLGCALAWPVAEFLSIRIFPWSIAHTQLAFTPFIQFADVLGVAGISFLMLWFVESLLALFQEREARLAHLIPAAFMGVAIFYGALRLSTLETVDGPTVKVALVQGNVGIAEKHNVKYFTINLARYRELSELAAQPGTLIVWPETVITNFIRDNIRNVTEDSHLPFLSSQSSVLIGALTYASAEKIYNSAIAVRSDGSVAPPYHKQILMPFGEFTPFAKTFPWLKELNQTAGEFSPGEEVSVFNFENELGEAYSVAPLICYEDIVSRLARQATLRGAQILINMTNDAWFGPTVAAQQHHLIAAFRAVENRRYLLRATNAGFTAVVDPAGRTVAELPIFEQGVLIEEVKALSIPSFFTTYVGPSFEISLALLAILVAIGGGIRKLLKS